MEFLGISGVEDLLQDEVPESIEKIRNAGISFWVLTGDKLETSLSVAKAGNIIQKSDKVFVISEGNICKSEFNFCVEKRRNKENNGKENDKFLLELENEREKNACYSSNLENGKEKSFASACASSEQCSHSDCLRKYVYECIKGINEESNCRNVVLVIDGKCLDVALDEFPKEFFLELTL